MIRYAVIPTRDRPQDFADCLAAIAPQVDHVIVISHQARYVHAASMLGSVIPYTEDPPNISRMWNLGIERAAVLSRDQRHRVAILNDDVVVPPGWFATVSASMHQKQAILGAPPRPGCADLAAGFAFILDGTAGLRADEQFQWWWGDTDLQRQAGTRVAIVPTAVVEHRHPNSTTVGELAVIAGQDRERYVAKWGKV